MKIEDITYQLQIAQDHLNGLIREEREKAPKAALATLYSSQSLLCQCLAQLSTLSSK